MLNRIAVVRTEFFCRQSVMPSVDSREQLLLEAGRWVKGGKCKIKESTIDREACHWLHHFSWKAGAICPANKRSLQNWNTVGRAAWLF
jgi:hypothetical protein